MKFTKEQQAKILEILQEKVPNITCPMCHNTESFTIQNDIFQISSHDNKRTMTSIVVYCGKCSYTMLFNPIYWGVMDEAGKLIV